MTDSQLALLRRIVGARASLTLKHLRGDDADVYAGGDVTALALVGYITSKDGVRMRATAAGVAFVAGVDHVLGKL